jgi:hypothetical protein
MNILQLLHPASVAECGEESDAEGSHPDKLNLLYTKKGFGFNAPQ